MTTVAILPVPTEKGGIVYQGVAGEKRSQGNTVEEAVDALMAQLPDDGTSPLVVVQNLRPDRFFDAAQQRRLGELMAAMHLAGDAGAALPADEQAELEALIEAELYASGERAAMLAALPRVETRGIEKPSVQGTQEGREPTVGAA